MIFADKLIALRKQYGLSQEQLAEKLNVSRQSVSKWEGAQSIPDINKIIQLSQIFGVSTDYLLKDELENEKDEYIETGEKSEELKYVSMEDANEFLNITQSIATYISIGVLICILAPIPLIVLAVLSEAGTLSFSEEQTAMVGVSVLLAMIAVAVALFIISGMKANKYEYYQKNFISQKNKYGKTYFVWICVDYPCRSITFNVADFVKRKSCDAVFVGTVHNNVRNLRNRTYDYKCRCVFQLVRTSGDTVFNSARRFGIYDDTLYCVYSFKPTNRT